MASEGDQGQSLVVYADGLTVAAEGEFGDGVEALEDGGEVVGDLQGGIESKAVAALALHGEPSSADQGAALPVAGAKGLEDQRQAFVGDLGGVVELVIDANILGKLGISVSGTEVVQVKVGTAKMIGGAGRIGVGGSGLAHFQIILRRRAGNTRRRVEKQNRR